VPRIKVIEKDPKDDPVLACDLKIEADYIVSKDDHLTDLREYQRINIVSSQEFLEVLKRNAGGHE
jgi:predicted nucleic acid-binding protein